jgi:cytochrome c-type biogenesis protein CcmH/NrfG
MMAGAARWAILGAAWTLALAGVAAAQPSGTSAADQAIALCRLAARSTPERDETLARGLAIAEAAARADPRDGRAHFAVFCNLGRRAQALGGGVFHPFEVARALRELDAAVRLAPDDPDVAAAKGAVLVDLPAVLGGDPAAGERWLRRALVLDPHNREARAYLAAVLARRGAEDEARRVRDAGS